MEQSPARASFSASSAGSESANARRPKPGEAVLDVATSSDPRAVAALRQQVAELQSRLRASEAKVAMWEECMQNMCHCVLLSPDMNDMYKDYCSDLLREVGAPQVPGGHACATHEQRARHARRIALSGRRVSS